MAHDLNRELVVADHAISKRGNKHVRNTYRTSVGFMVSRLGRRTDFRWYPAPFVGSCFSGFLV